MTAKITPMQKYFSGLLTARHRNVIVLLFLAYVFLRFFRLDLLPMFTDESIYLYWGHEVVRGGLGPFVSLTDGKQPLLIWIMGLSTLALPFDHVLISGRIVAVFFGIAGFIGMYRLSKELFADTAVPYFALVLYFSTPFLVVYERMALFDGPLSAVLIWTVLYAVKAARTGRLFDTIAWGMLLGLAVLIKDTAILYAAVTSFVFLLVARQNKCIKKTIFCIGIALTLAFGLSLLPRVSDVYPLMHEKNSQFLRALADILSHPVNMETAYAMLTWYTAYLGVPLLVLFGGALLILAKNRSVHFWILFLPVFVPYVGFSVFARYMFPRYIVCTVPFMIVGASFTLETIKKRMGILPAMIMLLAVLFTHVSFTYYLYTDFTNVPFPQTDRDQLITTEHSGYGLRETFDIIDSYRKGENLTIVTDGTFGLFPYAFNLQYADTPDLRIYPVWPLEDWTGDIWALSTGSSVLVVSNRRTSFPQELHCADERRVEKPEAQYPIILCELPIHSP